MKIVVTGGAGYIGSVITMLLTEAGHDVIVLDQRLQKSPAPNFVHGNIADFGRLFSKKDEIDAVIHCAAYIEAGESVRKPEKYWQNNTIGSLKLLEALRNLGTKKLIFSSTAAVYGNPAKTPITEDMPKNPTNPYGMTKLAIDMAISSECVAHGLAATSLRYFNVAGSYQGQGERHNPETHIIPLALSAAESGKEFTIFGNDYDTPDGTCVRDYIHVYDLARAHLLALDKLEPSRHSIYNLGNGQGFSNRQVINTVKQVTSKKLSIKLGPRRTGDPAVLIASSDLAKKELGWQPSKPDLATIVTDAWQFYQIIRQ